MQIFLKLIRSIVIGATFVRIVKASIEQTDSVVMLGFISPSL